MMDTPAYRLRRRLLNLGSGELVAAVVFAWLSLFASHDDPSGLVGLPLAAVGLVLVLVEAAVSGCWPEAGCLGAACHEHLRGSTSPSGGSRR